MSKHRTKNQEFFLILALLPTSLMPFEKFCNQMQYLLIIIKSVARAHSLAVPLTVIIPELQLKFLDFCLVCYEDIKPLTFSGLSPITFGLV